MSAHVGNGLLRDIRKKRREPFTHNGEILDEQVLGSYDSLLC